jgi:hypothetical protein|tara:strand:+ start:148 stop:435 length:288 start_codon:yes stop_codon:yes gene_type:complete
MPESIYSLIRPDVTPIPGVHIFDGEVVEALTFAKTRVAIGQDVICLYPLKDTRRGRKGREVVDYVRGQVCKVLAGPWLQVNFPEQVHALSSLLAP